MGQLSSSWPDNYTTVLANKPLWFEKMCNAKLLIYVQLLVSIEKQ